MKKRLIGLLTEILRYLRKVTLIVLGIIAVVAVSFVFTGGFSLQAFSDRMFWGAVVSMVIGGFGIISIMNLNRQVLGLPNVITKKEDARKMIDNNLEMRAAIEKRYDFGILFWLIGMFCVAISVLSTVIGGWIGVK